MSNIEFWNNLTEGTSVEGEKERTQYRALGESERENYRLRETIIYFNKILILKPTVICKVKSKNILPNINEE